MNKYNKKKNKKQEGITLVALIITIIVMLILVGVSIRVVVNSGILGIAKNAIDSTKTEYNEESNFGGVITIGGKQYASIEDYQEGNEMPLEITAGTRATSKSTYTSGEKTAVIPAGFTVSKLDDENTIAGGLVIYLIPEGATVNWETKEVTIGEETTNIQNTCDQFVWIPIDDINDMFICQGKTAGNGACTITVVDGKAQCGTTGHDTDSGEIDENSNPIKNNTLMAGRLYATNIGENFDANLENQIYTSGSGLREPDTVNDATYADGKPANLAQLTAILGEGYDIKENFKVTLQAEYNEIVKSVYENKGFWVGRYETSGMDNANHTVNIVAGTSTGINSTTWYGMYAKQKIYTSKKSLTGVGSGMILGAMHDQVLKFVNTEDYNIKSKGKVAHNLGGVYETGGTNYTGTYADYSKNIYDLEGNVYEWTTEADGSRGRVSRGRLLQQQPFGKLS